MRIREQAEKVLRKNLYKYLKKTKISEEDLAEAIIDSMIEFRNIPRMKSANIYK